MSFTNVNRNFIILFATLFSHLILSVPPKGLYSKPHAGRGQEPDINVAQEFSYKSLENIETAQSVGIHADDFFRNSVFLQNKMLLKLTTYPSLFVLAVVIGASADHEAHSYQHFHGPVTGHHQKITWIDKHGHHHHDYVAEPSYKFSYGVYDHHTKDMHQHKEHRHGKYVSGEYKIHEPGGNIRTVKYHSDEHGFHAHVHNSGPTHHNYR